MLEKLFSEIRDWKSHKFDRQAYMARVNALPQNYKTVYEGISDYMWSIAIDGKAVMDVLIDILDMLEDGARDNRDVLDIVGNDIIGFCDAILRELPNKTWIDKMKSDKNQKIMNKLTK